jgi:hypothetical protein
MSEQLAMNRAELVAGEARDQILQLFEQAPGFMALLEGSDYRFRFANLAFCHAFGKRDLAGKAVAEALPWLAAQGFVDMLDRAARSGEALVERNLSIKVARPDEPVDEIIVDILCQPLPPGDGAPASMFVQGNEVSLDKSSEALRSAHSRVLELAIGDNPLEQTLGELIRIVESTSRTGVMGSILLLDHDGKHLRHGAAPSLPQPYIEAIDGAEIGPCVGSCGTAAYSGAPVFVSDIATDPLWEDFKAVALPNGLRACWSIPIMTRGRKVLGTFAMYHREPREPTVRDLALVDLITQTAALVIDRDRAQAALQEIAAMVGPSPQSSSSS